MFDFFRKYVKICHMKDLKFYYKKAIKKGFAIGAFNFSNLEVLKAIVNSAEKLKSPVILAVSESALRYMGEQFVIENVKIIKENHTVPLFLHLDHGKSFEICKKAIDLGFDSVMIDASAMPFDENVKLTKQVCDYAHEKGVYVEGELGQIIGVEDNTHSDTNIFTDPEQAQKFVKETKVDSLAVAIGTSHGAYKYKGESRLRFDILQEIEKKLPNFPLVLHGASSVNSDTIAMINNYGGKIEGASGVSEELTRMAIKMHNIVKINIDTDLRMAFTAGVRKSLAENPENFDTRNYLLEGQIMVEKLVEHKIDVLLDSEKKA